MTENSASAAVRAMHERKGQIAIWTPKRSITFHELGDLSAKAQALFRRHGVVCGDHVLVIDLPGPRLFAAVLAALAMGAAVIFVEPWMAPSRIDRVLRLIRPKMFLAPALGKLWGVRVAGIWDIARWASTKDIDGEVGSDLVAEAVSPEAPAIITFSSGTSGEPKGVVRSHGYLAATTELLGRYNPEVADALPDLAIFPNVALLNLSLGRTTVLAPQSWRPHDMETVGALPDVLQPTSVACGPEFLARLIRAPGLPRLRFIVVGGALCDCALLEAACARFPGARVVHVYGGTEVEPVAYCDAPLALERSRARGLHQVLFVGAPIPELAVDSRDEGLWVSGPNVCPEYLGTVADNKLYKRRDDQNRLWHFMGDRVVKDGEGWWYRGRSFQAPEDFRDEQVIYAMLQSSASFIHRTPGGRRVLIGEGVLARRAESGGDCLRWRRSSRVASSATRAIAHASTEARARPV